MSLFYVFPVRYEPSSGRFPSSLAVAYNDRTFHAELSVSGDNRLQVGIDGADPVTVRERAHTPTTP
jgi:hypothetical protein